MSYTLGELIKRLEHEDPAKRVPKGFGRPHSYRGYYEQLAFEPVADTTVGAMLAAAKSALGQTFYGYKGGEFTMGAHTDVWLARYGESNAEQIGELLVDRMLDQDCTGLRALLDAAERRQEENESRIAILEGRVDSLSEDLDGALRRIELWRATVSDLVKRHFRDMESYDKQLRDVCELLQEPFPGEEAE